MSVTRFLDWLHGRHSTRTAVFSFGSVAAILFAYSIGGPKWLEPRMGGEQVLDVMLWPRDSWRTPDIVTTALEVYGDSGRDWYLGFLLADALFAGLYSVLLAVWANFASRKVRLNNRYVRVATIIPLVGGLVFDWGENLLLGIQTVRFPHQCVTLSWVASVVSEVKLVSYVEALLLLLAVLARIAWESIRKIGR